MKKNKDVSLEDITKKEISLVEANDKIAKLEKEKLRDKKIINEYKEREKTTARALILYERKVRFIRESSINQILELCNLISKTKDGYEEDTKKIVNDILKIKMLDYKDTFSYIENKLYDLCNSLEKNAIISNEDRNFITNKKPEEQKLDDIESRFDRLKREFNEKIGNSVSRKRGRPKKEDQSIIADIGLRQKVEKKIDGEDKTTDRLKEIFYDKPNEKNKVISNIPVVANSEFDFNEALNPNMSLKDIMSDLLSENKEEEDNVKHRIEKYSSAKNKTDVELIESGFIRNPVMHAKPVENKTIDPLQKKPTFDKRFLSIQNIINNSK